MNGNLLKDVQVGNGACFHRRAVNETLFPRKHTFRGQSIDKCNRFNRTECSDQLWIQRKSLQLGQKAFLCKIFIKNKFLGRNCSSDTQWPTDLERRSTHTMACTMGEIQSGEKTTKEFHHSIISVWKITLDVAKGDSTQKICDTKQPKPHPPRFAIHTDHTHSQDDHQS